MKTKAFSFCQALIGLVLLSGGALSAQTAPDLWIRDDPLDVGNEPNLQTTYFYISDDIWVRRLADPNYDPHPFPTASPTWTPLPHEGPCYRDPKTSSPNYIYVRIRNKGTAASSGTETLHVYWAKASTGLGWPGDWNDHLESPTCGGPDKLYGYEVTKARKNGATASTAEKNDYVAAIQSIKTIVFPGDPGSVTYFDKQDNVHSFLFSLGIHQSLRFLPWHREFIGRYEALLREAKPTLTLLYWDWTTVPSVTGPILGPSTTPPTDGYMGVFSGVVGAPFATFGISRSKFGGTPGAYATGLSAGYQSGTLLPSANYQNFWGNNSTVIGIERPSHNNAHCYNGGTMCAVNAARDPLFFMLHANCDRLWAKWQRQNSANVNPWTPAQAYDASQADPAITSDMRPWNGVDSIYPWTVAGGYIISKAPTHHSIVYPPVYDDVLLKVPVIPANNCCIIEIPFYPPPLAECAGFGDPAHLCLLARIEPVNVAEGADLGTNVKNNKKIAWKNTALGDCNVGPWFKLSPGRIGAAGQIIRNPGTNAAQITLRFDAQQTGFRTLYDYGTVRLRLEPNLYAAWANGGFKGQGVEQVGTNNEVLVLASGASMSGLLLKGRESGHIDAALELNRNYPHPFGDVYYLDMLQFEDQAGGNAVVGGQRYSLNFNVLSLVQKGSDWKYLEPGQTPADNWPTLNYDDRSWQNGTALFGYGRSDVVTALVGTKGKPSTAYFRQMFTVADPSFYHSLNLNMVEDDGVIVYLNGREIVRLNMPTGPVTEATHALAPMLNASARAYRSIDISNAMTQLLPGANLLAAEVHPAATNDVDLSFDLELAANVPPYPYQPPTVVITSPQDGTLVRQGANVPILADVLDPDGDLAQVRIYTNGILMTTQTSPPFSAVFTAPPLGGNRVSVEAQDQFGNLARMESVFAVVSNLMPSVVMTSPLNHPVLPAGSPVQLAASANDPDGSVTQVVFYVRSHMTFDTPVIQVGVATAAPYTAVATNLPPDHYLAFASATDNQGATTFALPEEFMIERPAGAPDLRISLDTLPGDAQVLTLEWDDEMAVLERATNIMGPWTPIADASSPYFVDPKLLNVEFFRLRLQ